jgi:hypothetical protein
MQLVDDKTDKGVKEAVRALAEAADGSIDAKNVQYTALHRVAMMGHAEVEEDVVGVAADCHAVDKWGKSPLHYGAWND